MWVDCEDDDDFDDDEDEYDDDTDNVGNQMSEYIESFDVIIGKSTKYDVQRKGGCLSIPILVMENTKCLMGLLFISLTIVVL